MKKHEVIIDGSEGEGGGQVIRSALSLSAITGKPVRVEHVRGKRKKPGLFRQHLTALRAAAEICGARVEGDELKSSEFAFHPGKIKAGQYDFAIGTAGAAILVAQTILPILSFADGPSEVTISGGTHAKWAPSFDYFNEAFLPQFRKMGGRARAEIDAYGFFPAGGGHIRLFIEPATHPKLLELIERGEKQNEQANALLANLKRSIGEREIKTLSRLVGLTPEQGTITHVDGPGPGNALTLTLPFEHVTEMFIGLGEHGIRAENVAKDVAKQCKDYRISEAAAGEYLADQLLLPMALLGGGVFTATDISQHTRTNMDIIRAFLPVNFTLTQTGRKCWAVEVIPQD